MMKHGAEEGEPAGGMELLIANTKSNMPDAYVV